VKLIGEEEQQCTANEGQIGEQIGVAGARAIFAHQDIPSPVIADFDPAPVSPDQVQPLLGRKLRWWNAGQIITGLGRGGAGLFDGALTAHHDQSSGKGEACGERFDVKGMELPGFDPPVTGVVMGKKGVSLRASKPWACLKRVGWLALICRR